MNPNPNPEIESYLVTMSWFTENKRAAAGACGRGGRAAGSALEHTRPTARTRAPSGAQGGHQAVAWHAARGGEPSGRA